MSPKYIFVYCMQNTICRQGVKSTCRGVLLLFMLLAKHLQFYLKRFENLYVFLKHFGNIVMINSRVSEVSTYNKPTGRIHEVNNPSYSSTLHYIHTILYISNSLLRICIFLNIPFLRITTTYLKAVENCPKRMP